MDTAHIAKKYRKTLKLGLENELHHSNKKAKENAKQLHLIESTMTSKIKKMIH